MGSYSVHTCDPEGAPLGALDEPPFAEPGRVVWLAETDLYARVRFWWRCCGAILVELMEFPDDPDDGATVTGRVRLGELSEPPRHAEYSVPCVGASWSLTLPCGDLAGEGCDCDTITAEADAQDDEPRHTCGPGIQYGCDVPDCDGDNGD